MTSISEIEHLARETTGADSARVFDVKERDYDNNSQYRDYVVLSVRSNGTSTIVGRRRTLPELLDLAKRGPLANCCDTIGHEP